MRKLIKQVPDTGIHVRLMKFLPSLSLVLLLIQPVRAQDTSRFDYYIGYGFYECFTIGSEFYFRSGKQSVGLSAGYNRMMRQENIAMTLSYNLALFQSLKDKSGRYRWHLNNKVALWQLEDEYYLWRAVSIIPSVNRRFNLYKRLGLSFDAGPSLNIALYEKRKTYQEVGRLYRVRPDFRILLIF